MPPPSLLPRRHHRPFQPESWSNLRQTDGIPDFCPEFPVLARVASRAAWSSRPEGRLPSWHNWAVEITPESGRPRAGPHPALAASTAGINKNQPESTRRTGRRRREKAGPRASSRARARARARAKEERTNSTRGLSGGEGGAVTRPLQLCRRRSRRPLSRRRSSEWGGISGGWRGGRKGRGPGVRGTEYRRGAATESPRDERQRGSV